jgi:4-hydroxythreonine-4-phosphate dehydrogenase
MKESLPKIGITLGDYNGVGPEVILKALNNPEILKYCVPLVYGSPRVLSFYKKLLNLNDMNFNYVKQAQQAQEGKLNLLVCWEEESLIEPGKASAVAADYAFMALEKATQDAKSHAIEALVTAPLDKSTINKPERPFKGHTEYLAEQDGNSDYLMMLLSQKLKVALVTGHIPIAKVSETLSKKLIVSKLKTLNQALQNDFGINKPKIAVLGLNPHAGDNGLLGSEENDTIIPAIEEANKQNIAAFGPYAADGFFGSDNYTKFDAVLAMYHDQGLIIFKYLGFEDGVNFTAGLTFVRTSPDHGTAYNIVGKNIAIESSLRNAIYTALDIFKHRKGLSDIKEPLKFSVLRKERFRMDF